MGALAGHLAHLQENLDFTFGELKSVLGTVTSGEAVNILDASSEFDLPISCKILPKAS